MTRHGIKRLRGEGPELVWPEEVILPLMKAVALKRAAFVGTKDRHPDRSATSDRAFFDQYVAARRAAGSAFGAAQGWRRKPRSQPFYMLLPRQHELRKERWVPSEGPGFWDHPETYYNDGIPIAVVHLYGSLKIADVPPGLIIDELPASWYAPEIDNHRASTTAYVYRPERLYSRAAGRINNTRKDNGDEK